MSGVDIVEKPPVQPKKVFNDIAEFDGERHLYFGGWYWIRSGDSFENAYVIVLDDGRYTANSVDLPKLGITFKKAPDLKPAPRWSPKHLKRFISGLEPNPSVDDTYDMVLSAYKSYIDYVEPGAPVILALYTIQSYLMPLFDTTAYIIFTGTKKSGKSRNLDVAEQLVFNPVRAVDVTPSSLFRIIEDWQATLLIDESDLDMPDRAVTLRSILLAGYKRGNVVLRTERTSRDKFIVERYDVFGPKIIVAPLGVGHGEREQMIFDRSIPIMMQRTTDAEITRKRIDPKDSMWEEIRNHLYFFAMKRWREVEKNYAEMPSKLDLISREYEKWSPLFSVAECFGLFSELEKYCREKVGEIFLEEESESAEVKLLRYIIYLFNRMESNPPERLLKEEVDGVEGYYISPSSLVSQLQTHYGKENWIETKRIGRIMTNIFGLKTKPLKIVRQGYPYYMLTRKILESLAKKYGINFDNPLES